MVIFVESDICIKIDNFLSDEWNDVISDFFFFWFFSGICNVENLWELGILW